MDKEQTPQPIAIPQCFMDLYQHAKGLKSGADWNHGTQAKLYRGPLSCAVTECEKFLSTENEPQTIRIDKSRLRNLTTGILHTTMMDIYEDLELITGMNGIMTHMLPNIMRTIEPWLKEKVKDPEYWDEKYRPNLIGDYQLPVMTQAEQQQMLHKYQQMPHPFDKK